MAELEILIVEDEAPQREMLRDALAREGHRVAEAGNAAEAVNLLRRGSFDLLLLDYQMPDATGLDVLRQARSLVPEADAVMLTAYGTVERAVETMKEGATDYLLKPVDLDSLFLLIGRIAERRRLVRDNEVLRRELEARVPGAGSLLYRSAAMAACVDLSLRVAPSRATVLLTGESGSGKELFARMIHAASPRAGRPMVTVHCAALPESLLEAELFGHEKGAFTGAHQARTGRLEEADGSTLFLDEIGELSPAVQVKLLRFLQEGEIQRVGSNRVRRVDARVISATHQNLAARVRERAFREDLYYRLNVVGIEIPPLRDRREDIPLLLDHFVAHFARENGKRIEGMTQEARALLLHHSYPGNVRELANLVERAVVVARGARITGDDLPLGGESDAPSAAAPDTLRGAVQALEQQMIAAALEVAEGNQSQAARSLGLSERMLRYKLKAMGRPGERGHA